MANLIDLLKQAISTKQNFTEMVNTSQQDVRVATTPEERSEGLRNQPQGTSMVFPNSTGSFNTKGMNYNIDINKYDNQGHLVQSYESVPPGIENLPMGNKTGTVVETPSEYKYGGKVYQTDGVIDGTRIPFSKNKGIDNEGNKTYYTREEEVEMSQRPGYYGGTFLDPEHIEQNEYMQKYVGVSEKDVKKKYRKKKYKNRDKELIYWDSQRPYNSNNQDISFSEGVRNETRKEWRQRNKQERDQELQEFAEWPQKVQELKNKEWAQYNQYRSESPEGNAAREKAISYFTNYYESPKFKQRVIDTYGKNNYKKIKAEKIEMLNSIDFYETNPADYMEEWERQDLMSNDEFSKYINSVENQGQNPMQNLSSTYDHRTHKAQYNLGQAENYGDMNPASVVVNEITHATGAMPQRDVWEYNRRKDKFYPNLERFGAMSVMPDSEIEIAQKRKHDALRFGHDSYSYEVKSDIESTRYELYDSDMYNFNDPNFKFTKKHIDYMRNNPEKFTKFSKTLSRDYEDEVILEMMNTFVSKDEITDDTNPNRSMQAKKGGFVKKFETGGTDDSMYMKIFYEAGDKTFESEAQRMTAALNKHYGKGNYEFIPIDLSSHNKETISKNVGAHIQNSNSSTDFTILGHNKSKLNSLFISEELQNKFGKETPDTVDTWSEIFATYQPKNYSGTCYFGSCMMGNEDRLHNFAKSYAESFTEESGVASKAALGPWKGIKQGIKTDTFDIAFFDPENTSGSGGQYISVNSEGDTIKHGPEYDIKRREDGTVVNVLASENETTNSRRRPSSSYDENNEYIPQSLRKHGGVVKFREEGMRTGAGTLIQKGLNVFRSDDKKVDPYFKATSFSGEVRGRISKFDRINLKQDSNWKKNNNNIYTYSSIDDIWELQNNGYISARTAVNEITKGVEYPRSHYKEEDDIIRNYLHSDKYKQRMEMYGDYDDPNETIKLRQEAFEDIHVYHKNNIHYFASEAYNRKLEGDNSIEYGDVVYPDITEKFGSTGSNIIGNYITMHPYEKDYDSPESRSSYGSTYVHEVGHAIGGRREDSPAQLSFNDWLNLAEGNPNFQEAPFHKTLPGTRGNTAGGMINSQKLNYWLETGKEIDELYENAYFRKSGWDKDMYVSVPDYRNFSGVQHITLWADGPGKFPIYDDLTALENKWHSTKPGSKERKNIQDQMLTMFENIEGSNFDLPNDYPNIEEWRNIAQEEKVAFGKTWIAGLNQRHAFNNIRRADESINPYVAMPSSYQPNKSEDFYYFDMSSIEEYLDNYNFVSKKSKKAAFKIFSSLDSSMKKDGVEYVSQRKLDSIMRQISSDEYNSMYENGKELFETDRLAVDKWQTKSINLEMDSRKIGGTPTGKKVPEIGMKGISPMNVHDLGPSEAYADLTAFRVWVAKDLGIPIEEDWDEDAWNYIMQEFTKLEHKRFDSNQRNERDRNLSIRRFIEHYGKEWEGWDKGAAGKHNTIADVDLDKIKNDGDMGTSSTFSKTGGFTNYKKGGAVQYQEEGLVGKPGSDASDTKKRNYWLTLNSNKNFVQRILDPSLNIGKEVQHPSTGLPMTHYMTSVEVQGRNLVIPQVVDMGDQKLHFIEDVNEAIKYALETGEYIITDTQEEAQWLAENNYKTKKFKNTYGHGNYKMGGWVNIPKYNTSHQKITKFQEEGLVELHDNVSYTGRSALEDQVDKKFLQDLMTKVVSDRKGKGSVEYGINRVIDLFNFTARQETFYNPVKNKNGTLPYSDTGYQDDKNNPNPALSIYQWKPQALETTIKRVKNYIGDNFMEQADAYGFIDENAKAGSKFMPYWFTELQEHKDPRKLSKTQLDILLLLDYAGGDAKLTDYIQGKIDPVDFYLKYHHRGTDSKNPMGIITKDAKQKYKDFIIEKTEGHYDQYNAFKEGGLKK